MVRHVERRLEIGFTFSLCEVGRLSLVQSVLEHSKNLIPHVRCRLRKVQFHRFGDDLLYVALEENE